MVIFLIDVTGLPTLTANCVIARLWSRRVIAVKRLGSSPCALFIAMTALVFAGLPTTKIFASFFAATPRAFPCGLKIPPFALSKSPRSMPSLRGIAPTRKAASISPKAVSALSVHTTPASNGNAQSSSSIRTPSSAPRAGVISNSWRMTG